MPSSLRGGTEVGRLMLCLTAAHVVAAVLAGANPALTDAPGSDPVWRTAVRFAVAGPLRDEPEAAPAAPAGAEERELPRLSHRREAAEGVWRSPDEAVQRELPATAIPSPSLSFEGLSNADNFTAHGWRVAPPDATGDVGPNHYVQVANSLYRVFDKSGNPLTPVRKLSSLFTALGGPCLGRDDGHPIVLYDALADRWVISQTCLMPSPNTHQLVAVSQTGDPAGAFYLYDFVMPNSKLQDEAKLGVWPDAYYMAANQFSGTTFAGTGAFAFDRARLLAGDAQAGYVYRDVAALDPDLGGMLPADVDGLRAPPAGAPGLFAAFAATEFGDPADAIRLFEFQVDFATPSASTFTERAGSPLLVAAFDPSSPPGLDDIEQPPPSAVDTESLDSVSDRLMYRLAYRRSAAHESLALTHTVNVGTGITIATHQAGVRHYELRRTTPTGAFVVHEQASGLNDGTNRWLGSAALDYQGNLAVAYSVSSTSLAPSVRYAGRLASDPAGGLFQGENTLQAGSFVQRSSSSRWGGYGGLSVDPADDCTFWLTGEYYATDDPATLVEWQTRIGRFRFDACTSAPRGTLLGLVRNAVTNDAIAGALVRADGHSRTTSASGGYSFSLVPGTYQVDVTRACYQPASATLVAVTNGGTTGLNFNLTPVVGNLAVTAPVSVAVASAGHTASVPNTGSTYTWAIRDRAGADLVALITAGQGTSQITFDAGSPGTTLFLTVTEAPSGPGCSGARRVQVDFRDVPPSHPFHDFVNNIAGNGITSGCAPGDYCPNVSTLRAQIAVFLLRAKEGVAYAPPPATGVFQDVPASDFFAPWIEELYRRGVTQGCILTPPMYCPGAAITRAQMAVFLLKTREGSAYTPPPADGDFDDVPVTHLFADWIEELAARGITTGCSLSPPLYCPDDPTTRGQMAVFLVRTFGLVFP